MKIRYEDIKESGLGDAIALNYLDEEGFWKNINAYNPDCYPIYLGENIKIQDITKLISWLSKVQTYYEQNKNRHIIEITREEAEYRLKEILGENIKIKGWCINIKIIKLIVDKTMFILYNVYRLINKGAD